MLNALTVALMAACASLPAGAQSAPPAAGSNLSAAEQPAGGPGTQRVRDPREAQYRVGPGDVLGVDVWKEPDASLGSAPVQPDGKISVPMLGQIPVAGLSLAELEGVLAERYRQYIRDPLVTVTVREINSQKVYMIGEVKKEGPIRVLAPLTVLQALAEAGGVTDYAKRKKIYILRSAAGGKQVMLPFDYDAVLRGQKTEQNIVLAPGDTVVVPR